MTEWDPYSSEYAWDPLVEMVQFILQLPKICLGAKSSSNCGQRMYLHMVKSLAHAELLFVQSRYSY